MKKYLPSGMHPLHVKNPIEYIARLKRRGYKLVPNPNGVIGFGGIRFHDAGRSHEYLGQVFDSLLTDLRCIDLNEPSKSHVFFRLDTARLTSILGIAKRIADQEEKATRISLEMIRRQKFKVPPSFLKLSTAKRIDLVYEWQAKGPLSNPANQVRRKFSEMMAKLLMSMPHFLKMIWEVRDGQDWFSTSVAQDMKALKTLEAFIKVFQRWTYETPPLMGRGLRGGRHRRTAEIKLRESHVKRISAVSKNLRRYLSQPNRYESAQQTLLTSRKITSEELKWIENHGHPINKRKIKALLGSDHQQDN